MKKKSKSKLKKKFDLKFKIWISSDNEKKEANEPILNDKLNVSNLKSNDLKQKSLSNISNYTTKESTINKIKNHSSSDSSSDTDT